MPVPSIQILDVSEDKFDPYRIQTVLDGDRKKRRERRKKRQVDFTQFEQIEDIPCNFFPNSDQKFQVRYRTQALHQDESFKMSESIGFGSLGATVNDRINEVPLEQESEGKVEEKPKEISKEAKEDV